MRELALDTAGSGRSNLALALFCLPGGRRRDALTFYHFCRTIDDIADDTGRPPDDRRALLARWRRAIELNADLPAELAEMIQRRKLDRTLFLEILTGVESDTGTVHYDTYNDLRAYCWKVAGAVGLVSVEIFGCRNPQSKIYAEQLGYALQLTNILRDVGEDARAGRVYLPTEDLQQFGLTEAALLSGRPEGDFQGLMNFEAARAEACFAHATENLPAEDRKALLPARIMGAFYQKILTHMKKDGFRVFDKRYRLSAWEKMLTALTAFKQ